MAHNLHIISGDDYTGDRSLIITAVDPLGAALDLTGVDLTFMVKRRRSDLDAAAMFTAIVGDGITLASPQSGATKGKAYIALDEADTAVLDGRYLWELEADSGGRITLAAGGLYVTHDLIVGV